MQTLCDIVHIFCAKRGVITRFLQEKMPNFRSQKKSPLAGLRALTSDEKKMAESAAARPRIGYAKGVIQPTLHGYCP